MENILLITVDSLRADHLGCYGYDRPTSPRIDTLAEEGHRFDNAFSNAHATRASFPAIMTSTYPLMYGGFERLSERQTVLAKPLSDAGFRTGGFHSNPFLSSQFGYAQGFDVFHDSKSEPTVTSRLREWVKQNIDEDGAVFGTLKTIFDTTEKHAGIEVGSPNLKADDITDKAIEFVRNGPAAGNFLWVHYMDVHHPYVPPVRYQELFRDPVSKRESVQLRRKMLEEPANVTDEEFQAIIDLYDAEIRFTDDEVSRLLDAVDEAWDDVGTFFTADHGEEFREHGAFSHSTLHEEGIHVPFLVDLGDGTSSIHGELVALLDLAPTVLDYAGAVIPDSYRGDSLRPVFEGGEWDREYIIGEAGYDDDGMPRVYYRDGRWKFISDEDGDRLFDLDEDPSETEDVSTERPDLVSEIRTVLEEHRDAVNATDQQLSEVQMSKDIEERLEALGYKE